MRLLFGVFAFFLSGAAGADLPLKSSLGAGHPSLILIADHADFITPSQRIRLNDDAWTTVQLSVADGVRLKYLHSIQDAPRIVITDSRGAVRRVLQVSSAEDVLRIIGAIRDGRETYRFACARCHGEDGNDDSYAYIRKLGGIGARLTADQIAARLHPLPMGGSGFAVRGYMLTRERLDALVAYVAGL